MIVHKKNYSGAAALLLALAATACAPLPTDLPRRPEMVSPHAEATVGIAGAATASWLPTPWWHAFHDETLAGLVAQALANNPSLTIAKSRIDAARRMERLAEINAGVNADASVSVQRERLTGNGIFPPPIGGSRFTQEDASVAVSYAFDWWGRNRALIAAATGDAAAAGAEEDAARLALSALVADAYFALADATARLDMACESAQKRAITLRLLKVRLAQGLDAADRARRAEAALAQDDDLCSRMNYEARSTRYRLVALLGEGPDAVATLPAAKLDTPLALPAALPLDWLAARPDVAAQRRRIEAEAARSDAARADFYPNVDITLLAGLQSIELAKWLQRDSFNGSFGSALHIPLFSTRTLQARLGLREAEYAAAVGDYNRTVLEATRQVADGYALTASLAQRGAAQAEALAATERAEALVATRKQRGLTDQLELLNNGIAVLAARQADSQLRAARLRATVALAQALGGASRPSPR
jgi:outer membrane protein, multidrug efflux system